MGIKATTISWGNVTVVAATATEIRDTQRRAALIIVNNSANTVYLGGTNAVTVANGLPLEPGANFETQDWIGPIWGIAAVNSNMRYMEFYW